MIFPVAAGQPVLIDFDQSVASPDWFTGVEAPASPVTRRRQWPRQLKGLLLGTAGISARNVRRFRDNIPTGPSSLVLMIGAATRGMGTNALYEDPEVRQIAFDIYPSVLTHFVADAHQIPVGRPPARTPVLRAGGPRVRGRSPPSSPRFDAC